MVRHRSVTQARLAAVGYGLFYRLPHGVRRRLVRLLTQKYTVGAVTLVRDADAGHAGPDRLLLLRQPPGRGWTLPAGLLRRAEPPVLGAVRELAEETGIELDPDDLFPAVPNAVVHTKGWVDVVFEARVPASGTALRVDGVEVHEAAWHGLDELPTLTHTTARLLGYYGIGPFAEETGAPAGIGGTRPGRAGGTRPPGAAEPPR